MSEPNAVDQWVAFQNNFKSAVSQLETAKKRRARAVSLNEAEYNAVLQALTLALMPPKEPAREGS